MPDAVDHLLLRTEQGLFFASIDAEGVVVCPHPIAVESLAGLHAAIHGGGLYIVAFAVHPGYVGAIRVYYEDGERVQRSVTRQTALEEIGEARLDLCADLANKIARHRFAAWKQHAEEQVAALRAVLTTATPGEA